MPPAPPAQPEPTPRRSLRDVLEHAQTLQRSGRHEAAEALCLRILQQIPDEPNAQRLLALALHAQGRPDQAIAQLQQLAERLPDDPGIRIDLANLLIDDGWFDEATRHLRHSLAIDPQSATACNSLAVACLRAGRLADSEAALVRGLELEPGRDDLLCNLGLLRVLQGRHAEAIELLVAATGRMPDRPERWSALAEALTKAGRFAEAAEAWRRRLAVAPPTPAICNEMGLALLRCGRLDASQAAFRSGLELDPRSLDLHHNLARALHLAGRHREAIEHGLAVLAVEPVSGQLRQMMSRSHLALGEREPAIDMLRQWQTLDPRDPEPGHLLAALGAEATPARAPDAYVQHVFDDFAPTFDARLASLQYRAPQLVGAAFTAIAGRLPATPEVLDAGCGTGLCGPLLKPPAGRLVGVDLSAAMLERARTRGVYDALEHGELTAFVQRSPQAFDAIVSADTLCYFGDLGGFLAAARSALRGRGALVFTLEALDDDATDYLLQVHGRYAHSQGYVLRALQADGFEVASIATDVLRQEMTVPVRGWIVAALRGAGA